MSDLPTWDPNTPEKYIGRLRRNALHESGHAIAMFRLGARPKRVWILTGALAEGATAGAAEPGFVVGWRECAMFYWAGAAAEVAFCGNPATIVGDGKGGGDAALIAAAERATGHVPGDGWTDARFDDALGLVQRDAWAIKTLAGALLLYGEVDGDFIAGIANLARDFPQMRRRLDVLETKWPIRQ